MLLLSFVIFLAVALAGDVMAVQVFLKRPIPMWLTRAHWTTAAVGLVVLGLELLLHAGSTAALAALSILAAGFLGGFALFAWLYAGRRAPLWAIAAHGSLGWIGVAALYLAVSGRA